MQKPVVILTDSSSDLTPELYAKHQIGVLPFIVTQDGVEYVDDGVSINQRQIIATYQRTKQIPKTAARNVEVIEEFFKPYLEQDVEIVYIGLSTGLSLMTTNVIAAVKQNGLEDRVFVVDSQALSSGIGLLVLKACDLREEGLSARQIYEQILPLTTKVQTSFVIDSVEFLHKGGRCSGLEMFFASILRLHPSIRMKGGKMHPAKKYMGAYTKIVDKYVLDMLQSVAEYDDRRVFITHCDSTPESIAVTKKILEEKTSFREIIVSEASSTITAHCGKGTLGILYISKNDLWTEQEEK